MAKILLEKWHEGFKKVSFTKLQVKLLGITLKEAKNNVDSILEGKVVIVEAEKIGLAKTFVKEAEKLGLQSRINLK